MRIQMSDFFFFFVVFLLLFFGLFFCQISDFLKVRIRSLGTTEPACPLAITRTGGQGDIPW